MVAFFVYVAHCSDGSYYTGITTDMDRRERAHNGEVQGGARYTKTRRPVRLVYHESYPNRSAASKRESMLKKLSHAQKARLVSQVTSVVH